MPRVRLAAVPLLAGLLPLTAGALGLGEITLRSALNQPFAWTLVDAMPQVGLPRGVTTIDSGFIVWGSDCLDVCGPPERAAGAGRPQRVAGEHRLQWARVWVPVRAETLRPAGRPTSLATVE